ncbi:putative pectinesterase [Helianthus annuus]|uniref:Pectinesterase n=1 Tax=Helianthus annuus TaxID=4232 RepID=A0A251UPL1_HELAN|nr:pectinesterase inhibitor 11 [Helianthus annuus]KAF5805565.1 putative pectinesterase [Helianthus annuus]KAJ0569979.1 putative pectinesterase [Helianthus annuus]KAJ0576677.1 putative pectinesterase [Helianthus annuus]KAJ0584309.1 putative pectinesterase [Helianthus annuus]KAJ0746942.1 putative pectinesterase [Helianthus annuus]
MAQINFLSLFILTFIATTMAVTPSSNTTTKTYNNYIKTSCNTTTYPSVCLKSLLPYATAVKSNPLRLVKQALSVTLKSASTTRSAISKLAKAKNITKGDAAVLRDCIEDIQDSIGEIKDSLNALSSLKSSTNKKFVISNAQTWTSAAITDEYSCTDGISDEDVSPEVKKKIRSGIMSIARMSSNALYLINHLKI